MRRFWGIFFAGLASGVAFVGTASADLVLAFTPADDGGVLLSISGSGTTSGSVGQVASFLNLTPDLLNLSASFVEADVLSGGGTIGGSTASLNRARVNKDGAGDDIDLRFTRSLSNTAYDIDAFALWNVDTLAFANLNSGSFTPSESSGDARFFESVTVTVTPEPSSLALLGVPLLCAAGFRRFRRRWFGG